MNENGHRSFESADKFRVELPGGGAIALRSAEEVGLFNESASRYKRDYNLTKMNDLVLLGVILSHQMNVFRAQQEINGMEPVTDDQDRPTGEYRMVDVKPAVASAAQSRLIKATQEIRAIEQALGIDKKSRESGGTYNTEQYIRTLKKAGREFALRITRRCLQHEWLANEMRWRIRLLRNGDDEDRAYHGVTQESIIEFAEQGLAIIEQSDRDFANEKGKLVVGKL